MKAKDKKEIVEDIKKLDWSLFIQNEVQYHKTMNEIDRKKIKKGCRWKIKLKNTRKK